MTDKHYTISIVQNKPEQEEKIKRTTTLYQEEIESVGGIGNYIESLDSILSEHERIEVRPFWQ